MQSIWCADHIRRSRKLSPRAGRTLPLWLLLVTMLPVPGALEAACTGGGGPDAEPLESVDFLRSYRAGLHSPARLAVDADGRVYIADPRNRSVVVRRADGKKVLVLEHLGNPVSVAVSENQTIYIGDADTGRVDAFSLDGSLLNTFGQGNGEFEWPSDIAVDPISGTVLVADAKANQIKLYSADGVFQTAFGDPGNADGQFDFPVTLALRNNEIFVVDQHNSRIQVFDLSGDFQFCISSRNQTSVGFFTSCGGGFICGKDRRYDQGIWVDAQGRIYVVDALEGAIYVMGRNGVVVSVIGHFEIGPGQLRTPTDLAVDPFGRIFVASNAGSRLDIFGAGNYSDPETYIPGNLQVDPDPLDRGRDEALIAYLEIPGYSPAQIVRATIVANGIASPVSVTLGDFDNDTIPDAKLVFGPDLIGALPVNSNAEITVTGEIAGLQFEESDIIRVISPGDQDSDGDGVSDQIDICAGTAPGAFVTPDGCDIAQQCPCDLERGGKGKGASARGQYMQCVTRVANLMVELGAITPRQKGRLLQDAARSECPGTAE